MESGVSKKESVAFSPTGSKTPGEERSEGMCGLVRDGEGTDSGGRNLTTETGSVSGITGTG